MKSIVKALVLTVTVCIFSFGFILWVYGSDAPAPDISDLLPQRRLVPDDQNAFPRIIEAAGKVALPPDMNLLLQYIDGKPVDDSFVADLLIKNKEAASLLDLALGYNQCQAANVENRDYIEKYHQVAILLTVQATHDRLTNHLDQSIRSTTLLLRFGDMLNESAQSLSDFGAAARILQLGLNQAALLTQNPSISTVHLKSLSESLSNLKPLDKGLQQAFRFKFQDIVHQIDSLRSSKKNVEQTFTDTALLPYMLRKTTWFPGYLFKENETKQKLAILYRDTIQNIPKFYSDMNIYDLPQYLGLVGGRSGFILKPNVVGRLFYAFTTPEIETYLEGKCQLEGSIQGIQLAVALQLFNRNKGNLPESLDALCPEYLSSIPLDPFDGNPFRYSASKAIIYSVGKDLKDSGGSMEIPPGETYGEDYPKTWIALDGVFKIGV